MGKTARWFRGLLGKKDTSSSSKVSSGGGGGSDVKPKKRWSFVKSSKDKEHHNQNHSTYSTSSQVTERIVYNERRGFYREVDGGGGDIRSTSSSVYLEDVDSNKHAIAVAAATAAVAEAAVAAAQAAAAVVKLTSSGRCTTAYVSGNGASREDWAAVRIQAAFRGYLARRALHALIALVKLQALVRGHIVRKKTAETMRCMQALVRVQSRARAGRAHISETLQPNKKLSKSHNSGPATPEKYERAIRSNSTRHDRDSTLKRNWSKPNHSGRNCLDHRMDEQWDYHRETPSKTTSTYDDKSDKILEIDPGKPYFNTKRWNAQVSQHALASDRISRSFTTFDSPSKDSTTAHLSSSSQSSGEVQSVNPRISQLEIEDEAFSTAQNSPQFYSASSRGGSIKRGPFTPTTSDCSRSYFSGYSDYPNYMANTESSKAKVRSQSAPKQRLEFEKSSSTKRYSVQGFGDSRSNAQRASAALHANFASKAYPGSGRLDRLGMPIRRETVGYNGMYRTKY